MTNEQINTEIKNTKKVMNCLLECYKDISIDVSERNEYYKEYLELSGYFLKLSRSKHLQN